MNFWNRLWKTICALIIWSLLPAVFFSSTSAGSDQVVIATGVAAIQGENIAGARQAAIQDALRQALEQGVGLIMDSTSVVTDDDLMEKIYTHTEGYIKKYDVIKEQRKSGGLYRVKIKANIKTEALRDGLARLGITEAIMDYPRILIIRNPEENISPESQTAEIELIKNFTDEHFNLVDSTKSRELHGELRDLLKVSSIDNVAAQIGLKHHAEIVIIYSIQATGSEFDGIMEKTQINFQTRAIVTTTGQILTAEAQSIMGVGMTPALARIEGARRVSESISQNLKNKILSWWMDYIANGIPYIITLQTQSKGDWMVIKFQRSLESIPGVVSLSERSSGGGITEMMVKYKGNSVHLKREILTALYDEDDFKNLHTMASKGRFLVFSVL